MDRSNKTEVIRYCLVDRNICKQAFLNLRHMDLQIFYGIDTCSTMSIFVHVFSFHYSNEIVSRAFLLHSFNNSTKYETDASAINRLYFSLLLVFKTCLTRLRVITLVAQNNDWAQVHWTFQINDLFHYLNHVWALIFNLWHTDFQNFRVLIHVGIRQYLYMFSVIIPSIHFWYFLIIRWFNHIM